MNYKGFERRDRASIKILSRDLTSGAEEKDGKRQSGQPVFWPRTEKSTSQIPRSFRYFHPLVSSPPNHAFVALLICHSSQNFIRFHSTSLRNSDHRVCSALVVSVKEAAVLKFSQQYYCTKTMKTNQVQVNIDAHCFRACYIRRLLQGYQHYFRDKLKLSLYFRDPLYRHSRRYLSSLNSSYCFVF